MKRLLILLVSLLPLAGLQAQTQNEPLVNTTGREIISLDGSWNAIIDPYETGYYDYRRQPVSEQSSFFADRSYLADRTKLVEYDFDLADSLRVPGDWNTQRPELYYYEGTIWYRTKFYVPKDGKRTYLRFDGANYETVVGLNGHVLGKHVGGFTPFNFDITDLVRENEYNTLIVKVDNQRFRENVPTHNFDWWNYGGITRSVYLIRTPQTFIRDAAMDYASLPFCLEGVNPTVEQQIRELMEPISKHLYTINSQQRQWLHLAAVMVNNFGNAINAMAQDMLQQHHIPFEILHPLITMTAEKIKQGGLWQQQTGPARRQDQKTIDSQRQLLADNEKMLQLYDLLTEMIQDNTLQRKKRK